MDKTKVDKAILKYLLEKGADVGKFPFALKFFRTFGGVEELKLFISIRVEVNLNPEVFDIDYWTKMILVSFIGRLLYRSKQVGTPGIEPMSPFSRLLTQSCSMNCYRPK